MKLTHAFKKFVCSFCKLAETKGPDELCTGCWIARYE